MTIQIEIKPHKAGGSVHVSVFEVDPGPGWLPKTQLRMDTNGHIWCWEPVSPKNDAVSFTLPDDTIHQVVQALLGWVMKRDGGKMEPFNFTNASGTDFRAEYTAERERVDKLLDVVVMLAEN